MITDEQIQIHDELKRDVLASWLGAGGDVAAFHADWPSIHTELLEKAKEAGADLYASIRQRRAEGARQLRNMF